MSKDITYNLEEVSLFILLLSSAFAASTVPGYLQVGAGVDAAITPEVDLEFTGGASIHQGRVAMTASLDVSFGFAFETGRLGTFLTLGSTSLHDYAAEGPVTTGRFGAEMLFDFGPRAEVGAYFAARRHMWNSGSLEAEFNAAELGYTGSYALASGRYADLLLTYRAGVLCFTGTGTRDEPFLGGTNFPGLSGSAALTFMI